VRCQVARLDAVEPRRAVRNGAVTESLRGGTTVHGKIKHGKSLSPFRFNYLCGLPAKSWMSHGRFGMESPLPFNEMAAEADEALCD
jgi:hypothetical protein